MNELVTKDIRREFRHTGGKFKCGTLPPLMAVPFIAGESGLLEQTVVLKLDPIAGQMISKIHAEVTVLAIPAQAVDLLLNDGDEHAGVTELMRRKAMAGTVLFGMENEGELTKRLGIEPMPYSGVQKTSVIARIAYNCAINYMRKRRYIYATLLDKSNMAVSPAIIGETVLDRFNAALDPDKHINGNVPLRLSSTDAPLKGIAQYGNGTFSKQAASIAGNATGITIDTASGADAVVIARKAGNPVGNTLNIWADLAGVEADGMSLTDLYNAELADKLIRRMRAIAEANKQDGEDAVLRAVFGLSTDVGQHPFVLYNKRMALGNWEKEATDAAGLRDEVSMTYTGNVFDFAVPVPATELGCVVVTLCQVTPDETILHQPHPIFSEDWGVINHAAQQMNVDPVPVIKRQLYADIGVPEAATETTRMFYTGHNETKRNYLNYGFNRHLDPEAVAEKTVMWLYPIPAGVTPDNILYPPNFLQYPFIDQQGEVVTYDIKSLSTVSTPMFFGPSPVEKLAIVEDNDLLGEDE